MNEAVVARAAARAELVAERKTIVEHGFGTRRNWGHDTFLMRGLAKVRAEFSLSAWSHALRRVLNLRSVGGTAGPGGLAVEHRQVPGPQTNPNGGGHRVQSGFKPLTGPAGVFTQSVTSAATGYSVTPSF